MGQRTDTAAVIPASMSEIDMVVDNIGLWTAHCHVDSHLVAGMQIKLNVSVLVEEFYIPDDIVPE